MNFRRLNLQKFKMKKELNVSAKLALPIDIITCATAILAIRGVGKTYTASVLAEEMLDVGTPTVVIDPTGAWWGLKSSHDGKKAGFPVVVFGGDHADLPLEETAGETIATAIVEQQFSAVIDLSHLRKGATSRFMSDFAETLYRLNREPLHLIVDEADAVAPQRPQANEARMLGAMEDIVRRGRIRGLGCTLITQRPAVINKSVLTQCEMLVMLRLTHPRDLAPVREWIEAHSTVERAASILDTLPSLPRGEAWFWCPSADLCQRVKVRQRKTFDSSATPKIGETIVMPKVLAAVDIKALGAQIQSSSERAKENDPKELKAKVAALEKEVKELTGGALTIEMLNDAKKQGFDEGRASARGLLVGISKKAEQAREILYAAIADINDSADDAEPAPVARPPLDLTSPLAAPPPAKAKPAATGTGALNKAQARVLTSLFWLRSEETTPAKVAFFADYTVNGHFNNTLGSLRAAGWVAGWQITPAGIAQLPPDVAKKPTGPELREWMRAKLSTAENRILDVLMNHRGRRVAVDQLAQQAGYTVNGHFNNSLGKLRTLSMAEGGAREGGVKAAGVFFE
jgi:hypothetical protein